MFAIITPDHRGVATAAKSDPNGHIARIHAMYPDAIIVPVLNGGTVSDLETIAHGGQDQWWLCPLISKDESRGMVAATLMGYRWALERDSNAVMVKLDVAEHPLDCIQAVADAALLTGSAVADLDFSKGDKLVPGSYDWYIHREVFPTLYASATKENLRLSCAHGFQAHIGRTAAEILDITIHIIEECESVLGRPMSWGLDGAMAIVAASMNALTLMHVPPVQVRNRSHDKINGQLINHLTLMRVVKNYDLF